MAEKPNSVNPQDWIDDAERDLKFAEIGILSGDAQITRGLCLLSHLIAEKALKALYLKKNGELPGRIHNLVELASAIDLSELKRPEIDEIIRRLDEFRVPMKYPKGEPLPPWNLAVKALEDAKTVLELVKKLI